VQGEAELRGERLHRNEWKEGDVKMQSSSNEKGETLDV
jgi:hypothetical protein